MSDEILLAAEQQHATQKAIADNATNDDVTNLHVDKLLAVEGVIADTEADGLSGVAVKLRWLLAEIQEGCPSPTPVARAVESALACVNAHIVDTAEIDPAMAICREIELLISKMNATEPRAINIELPESQREAARVAVRAIDDEIEALIELLSVTRATTPQGALHQVLCAYEITDCGGVERDQGRKITKGLLESAATFLAGNGARVLPEMYRYYWDFVKGYFPYSLTVDAVIPEPGAQHEDPVMALFEEYLRFDSEQIEADAAIVDKSKPLTEIEKHRVRVVERTATIRRLSIERRIGVTAATTARGGFAQLIIAANHANYLAEIGGGDPELATENARLLEGGVRALLANGVTTAPGVLDALWHPQSGFFAHEPTPSAEPCGDCVAAPSAARIA